MKTFQIYLKSHCEAPDYEDYVETEDIQEAIEYWNQRLDLGREYISQNIQELTN